MPRDPDIVTASELAKWVYSRTEWRKRRLGLSAPDQTRFDAGKALHERRETAQRRGTYSLAVGRVLVVLVILGLLGALLWR